MPVHSLKFQTKYLKFAKAIASDNNICGSRQLAAIIVDANHKVRGIGYNGPPAGTPHCDSYEFLSNYFWRSLTNEDRECFQRTFGQKNLEDTRNEVCRTYENSGCCPRKLVGAESGERSDLCSCQHAEQNAINNSGCDIAGCVMYCMCPPCIRCAGSIINARLVEVHYPRQAPYQWQANLLLKQAGVLEFQQQPESLLPDSGTQI